MGPKPLVKPCRGLIPPGFFNSPFQCPPFREGKSPHNLVTASGITEL